MSKLSLSLQSKSLEEMLSRKPFSKKLAGLSYQVLPEVYKGSTDTELFCHILKTKKLIKKTSVVWDIGTGTGLIALYAKSLGAEFVLATDINPQAVKNARQNSLLLDLKIETKQANLFEKINKKFDLIIFNPPFTNNPARKTHEASFWDKDHKTVQRYVKEVGTHLTAKGRALIGWSSFGNVAILKKLAQSQDCSLIELGRQKGKRNFIYYVYEII